jgi:hypothetical protein
MAEAQQPAAAEGVGGDPLEALEAALAGGETSTEGEGAEEWKPPTRAEWEAHQAALEAEKAKLQRARTQAERLRREKGSAPAAAAAAPPEGAPAADAAGTKELAALQQRAVAAERRAVVAAARVQLTQRGADPGLLDLAVARLNTAEVDFDGDEPILDAWLDELEEKYPKLFTKPNGAPVGGGRQQVGTVNQGSAAVRTPKKLGFGDQVLAASKAKR